MNFGVKPGLKSGVMLLGVMSALVLGGCQSISHKAESAQVGFQLRSFQEEVLPNGLKILWIQDQSLPRVSLNLMVQTGAIDETSEQAGINTLMLSLLDQGSSQKTAFQISDELAEMGAEFGASGAQDFSTIQISGLSPAREKLLNLYSEIVLLPAFHEAEIERRRSLLISGLKKTQDQPSSFADELMDHLLFGEHPYGRPTGGKIKSVKSLSKLDLVKHYQSYYRPNNSILAVVGYFDADFQKSVRSRFSSWEKQELKVATRVPISTQKSKTVLMSQQDLQQTQVRFGMPGIDRKNPDFIPLRLANLVFGGAFASRLNQRIRDDLGLTYSISSANDARLDRGSFEISTFTRHDKVAETILETRKLLADFISQGVTDSELDAAKALLIGQFPAALETADRTAFNLMVLRRYQIQDEYLNKFHQNLMAVTRDQVNRAIQKNIQMDHLQVLIYSDEAKIKDQLTNLGAVEKQAVRIE